MTANNILKPHTQISKLTIALGVFIILSASFTRQILNFIKAHSGGKGVSFLIDAAFIILFVSILFFAMRDKSKSINILFSIIVLVIGTVLAWQIKITEEKIHILEYGILGWFAARDLMKANTKIKGSLLACIVCVMVGVLDEVFQAVLPYRYFELRDIGLNGLGGIWGITLHLTGKE